MRNIEKFYIIKQNRAEGRKIDRFVCRSPNGLDFSFENFKREILY